MSKEPKKLFWCETDDHDEDWFIVATTSLGAKRNHAHGEGYNVDDVTAKLVAIIPPEHQKAATGPYPTNELLTACGGIQVLTKPFGGEKKAALREATGAMNDVWRFGEHTYKAGDIVANTAQRQWEGENEAIINTRKMLCTVDDTLDGNMKAAMKELLRGKQGSFSAFPHRAIRVALASIILECASTREVDDMLKIVKATEKP